MKKILWVIVMAALSSCTKQKSSRSYDVVCVNSKCDSTPVIFIEDSMISQLGFPLEFKFHYGVIDTTTYSICGGVRIRCGSVTPGVGDTIITFRFKVQFSDYDTIAYWYNGYYRHFKA